MFDMLLYIVQRLVDRDCKTGGNRNRYLSKKSIFFIFQRKSKFFLIFQFFYLTFTLLL